MTRQLYEAVTTEKKTKQWNIVCAFTHGWLDTGGESTNPTFSQGLRHRTVSQIRTEKASSKQDQQISFMS